MNFLASGSGTPMWLITDAPRLRSSGWDTYTGDVATLHNHEYWETRNGGRKVLRLYQDGTLFFRAAAGADFLARGTGRLWGEGTLFLNSLAVVESHLSFVRLYAAVVRQMLAQPTTVTFNLRFHDAHQEGARLAITKNYPSTLQFVDNPETHVLSSSAASDTTAASIPDLLSHTDAVAYSLVACFYRLFDADASLIPYVVNAGGRPTLNANGIPGAGS
jgi:hypothetical protein